MRSALTAAFRRAIWLIRSLLLGSASIVTTASEVLAGSRKRKLLLDPNDPGLPLVWKRNRLDGRVRDVHERSQQTSAPKAKSTALFQIPIVMAEVAKSMSAGDLLRLRLTCRLWNIVMCPELRKKHAHIRCSSIHDPPDPTNNFRALCSILQGGATEIPFSKLQIRAHGNSNYECTTETLQLFNQAPVLALLRVWTTHLTCLEICMSDCSRNISLAGLRTLLFSRTPALTDLKLSGILTDAGPSDSDEDLIEQLPRLRKLSVSLPSYDRLQRLIRDLLRAGTALRSLSISPTNAGFALRYLADNFEVSACACESLKELNFGTHQIYENTIQRSLIELTRRKPHGLRLTAFERVVRTSESWRDEIERFTEFLTMQAPFLRQLTLHQVHFLPAAGLPAVTIPRMVALQRLTLNVEDLHFLQFDGFPNLRTLSISTRYHLGETALWNDRLRALAASAVTELDVDRFSPGHRAPGMLQILAPHFPHVTRLTIRMQRRQLSDIWDKWPLLQRLDISISSTRDQQGGSLDQDLTGIGADNCTLLREKIAAGQVSHEDAWRIKVAPGITDLKNLREFRLAFDLPVKGEDQITDVCGYFGFAACGTRLQRICVRGGAHISDACYAAIKERLGIGSIITLQ